MDINNDYIFLLQYMQRFPTATSPQSLPATITDALMLVLDVTEETTVGTTAMNSIVVSHKINIAPSTHYKLCNLLLEINLH